MNAEIFTANSMTLTTLGISDEIDKSGRYNSLRATLGKMDPKAEEREFTLDQVIQAYDTFGNAMKERALKMIITSN